MARRAPRTALDDDGIDALKRRAKRYAYPDPELPRHYIRVTPKGLKSFWAVARDLDGKQVWIKIGDSEIGIDKAREKARKVIKALRSGESPEEPQSFHAVAEGWFKRQVEAKGLRSAPGIRRALERIREAWKGRLFTSIRRADVAKLLDKIEDDAGPVAADFALAIVRNIANWYATRHEGYASPVVKGMRRSKPTERARDRILDDAEILVVWKQAEANGTFGAFVRLLLLTGQRREKVATMKWSDLGIDGAWNVASEAREKGTGGELMLPEIALEIIRQRPRFADNPYIFAGRGATHFQGYSKAKRACDDKVQIAPWTLHDLRRTARSLMSRAGVRPDIAERVMGHAIAGVEGVYDRHSYRDEKAHALRVFASLISTIVNPPTGNVVRLAGAQ